MLMSAFSGWGRLAKRFADTGDLAENWIGAQSASFPFAYYPGILTIGVSQRGLQLRVAKPFQMTHAPLLIPWEHVSPRGAVKGSFGVTRYEIQLGNDIDVVLPGEMGRSVQAWSERKELRRSEAAAAAAIDWGPDPDVVQRYSPSPDQQESPPQISARARESADRRCPYCLDGLETSAVATCSDCATPHHAACLEEHGGCVVLACPGKGAAKRSRA
jgi:hypothetical protein